MAPLFPPSILRNGPFVSSLNIGSSCTMLARFFGLSRDFWPLLAISVSGGPDSPGFWPPTGVESLRTAGPEGHGQPDCRTAGRDPLAIDRTSGADSGATRPRFVKNPRETLPTSCRTTGKLLVR